MPLALACLIMDGDHKTMTNLATDKADRNLHVLFMWLHMLLSLTVLLLAAAAAAAGAEVMMPALRAIGLW